MTSVGPCGGDERRPGGGGAKRSTARARDRGEATPVPAARQRVNDCRRLPGSGRRDPFSQASRHLIDLLRTRSRNGTLSYSLWRQRFSAVALRYVRTHGRAVSHFPLSTHTHEHTRTRTEAYVGERSPIRQTVGRSVVRSVGGSDDNLQSNEYR